MPNGRSLKRFCLLSVEESPVQPRIIAVFCTACCMSCALVALGATCMNDMVSGTPSMSASGAGQNKAFGTHCSRHLSGFCWMVKSVTVNPRLSVLFS